MKGFQPTAFSRRLSLGAAQAMLWLWRRKELHLAHMTEHSCALTPQTLVTKAGTKKFFFVLASTCHGAWTWEAEVVETQTYTLRGHNEWAWLTVTNVKDWHCVPYEWTINKVQTEQFGFLCMKQRGASCPLVVEALCRKRRPLVHQRVLLLRCYGVDVRSGS